MGYPIRFVNLSRRSFFKIIKWGKLAITIGYRLGTKKLLTVDSSIKGGIKCIRINFDFCW